MTEFIHYDLTTAYRKKATAMVMRCQNCHEKFVSHRPTSDVQICQQCEPIDGTCPNCLSCSTYGWTDERLAHLKGSY